MFDRFNSAVVVGFQAGVEKFIGKFEAKLLDHIVRAFEAEGAGDGIHHPVAALELDGVAFFLDIGEFFDELGELGAQTAFLQSEIAKILFIAAVDEASSMAARTCSLGSWAHSPASSWRPRA